MLRSRHFAFGRARASRLGTIFFLALGALSCFSRVHRSSANAPDRDSELVLSVDNQNWSDVVIYIVHDGSRTRFLTVRAVSAAEETIPSRLISSDASLALVAHRVGGSDDYLSPKLTVRNSKTVALTLAPKLTASSVGVW